MYTTAAKNNMLGALGVTHASLHTAYSATGANEVTGGSPAYARKSITLAAASGGSRAASTQPVFDVPAGTYRWFGFWDAVSGGNFLGMVPIGGDEKEYTTDTATEKIRCPAHGYVADQKIVFYNGTVPGGLTAGTVYFVRAPGTDDFEVAATAGGAAINLTAVNTLDSVVSTIIEDVFAAQGTETLGSAIFNLNF
jgi:hypothetical protein